MRYLALRGRTFPTDLNHAGSAFGGFIMSKMDKAASIAVEDIVYSPAVTVSVSDLHFLKPVNNGDIFSVYTEIIKIGNTSITIHVMVETKCKETRKEHIVTEADFVFVTVDENKKPIPVRSVLREDVSEDILKLIEEK